MSLLTPSEALSVSDSFLHCLYGEEIFARWKELKLEMEFLTEREYVSWLLDVADNYHSELSAAAAVKREEASAELRDEERGYLHSHYTAVPASTAECSTDSVADNVENEIFEQQAARGKKKRRRARSQQGIAQTDVKPELYEQLETDYENIQYDEAAGEHEQYADSRKVGPPSDEGTHNANVTGDAESGPRPPAGRSTAEAAGREVNSGRVVYRCQYCSYASGVRGNVPRHEADVHLRRAAHGCPYCRYRCSQKAALRGHLVNRHGAASEHRCQECGKYCASPSTLRRHQARHITGHITGGDTADTPATQPTQPGPRGDDGGALLAFRLKRHRGRAPSTIRM